jgi:hypothetical protein
VTVRKNEKNGGDTFKRRGHVEVSGEAELASGLMRYSK